MDALKQCACAYEKLLDYEYEIVAGSKKTLLEMTLFFSKEQLMHLIGLHKLTDIQLQRYNKEKLYEMIINGELTYEYIQKSSFFSEIEERIKYFPILESVLDSHEMMIKYKRGFASGTAISASYIIICEYEDTLLHYFVDRQGETNRYFGKSFFGRNDNKFLKNQQTFKVLIKRKKNISDGTCLILKQKEILKNI